MLIVHSIILLWLQYVADGGHNIFDESGSLGDWCVDEQPIPETMLQAVRQFADPQVAHDFLVQVRWPNGVACPRHGCGNANVVYMRQAVALALPRAQAPVHVLTDKAAR